MSLVDFFPETLEKRMKHPRIEIHVFTNKHDTNMLICSNENLKKT